MTALRTAVLHRSRTARTATTAQTRRALARALDRAVTPASREELLYLTRR